MSIQQDPVITLSNYQAQLAQVLTQIKSTQDQISSYQAAASRPNTAGYDPAQWGQYIGANVAALGSAQTTLTQLQQQKTSLQNNIDALSRNIPAARAPAITTIPTQKTSSSPSITDSVHNLISNISPSVIIIAGLGLVGLIVVTRK